MTAYEAGTLPYFIRWTIVLFRTLEMSLIVPEHSDLLVHVPGEVQAMMEVQLPITRALYDLTMEIMEDRDQRVLFVPYRYINLRRITSVHFNTSQPFEYILMASALRECAGSQVGEMHLENDRSLSKRLIKDERYTSSFQTPGVPAE